MCSECLAYNKKTVSMFLDTIKEKGVALLLGALLFIPTIVGAQEFVPVSGEAMERLGITGPSLGTYFNNLFDLALTFGAILAVLIIAVSGLEYMTTEAVSGKGSSKERIQQALLGLLMLLGTWLFFYEINRDALNLDFSLGTITTEVSSVQEQPSTGRLIQPVSSEGTVHCVTKGSTKLCYPSKEKCLAENGSGFGVGASNPNYGTGENLTCQLRTPGSTTYCHPSPQRDACYTSKEACESGLRNQDVARNPCVKQETPFREGGEYQFREGSVI